MFQLKISILGQVFPTPSHATILSAYRNSGISFVRKEQELHFESYHEHKSHDWQKIPATVDSNVEYESFKTAKSGCVLFECDGSYDDLISLIGSRGGLGAFIDHCLLHPIRRHMQKGFGQ